MKTSTWMQKVFDVDADRKYLQRSSLLLRFRLDGQVTDGDDTPRTLGMEDLGMIDCMLEQTGC